MYTPNEVPADPRSIPEFLRRELLRLSDAIHETNVKNINFEVINRLPSKTYEGMVFNFAAGIAGVEAGLYEFIGGVWNKL